MMKGSYFIIGSLILSILFISCGKNVEEVNPDFIGVWRGDSNNKTYTIRIGDDGQGRYSYVGDGEMGNSEGRVRYRNGKLKFGALSSIKVDKYPEFDGEFWGMVVEGVEYVRI